MVSSSTLSGGPGRDPVQQGPHEGKANTRTGSKGSSSHGRSRSQSRSSSQQSGVSASISSRVKVHQATCDTIGHELGNLYKCKTLEKRQSELEQLSARYATVLNAVSTIASATGSDASLIEAGHLKTHLLDTIGPKIKLEEHRFQVKTIEGKIETLQRRSDQTQLQDKWQNLLKDTETLIGTLDELLENSSGARLLQTRLKTVVQSRIEYESCRILGLSMQQKVDGLHTLSDLTELDKSLDSLSRDFKSLIGPFERLSETTGIDDLRDKAERWKAHLQGTVMPRMSFEGHAILARLVAQAIPLLHEKAEVRRIKTKGSKLTDQAEDMESITRGLNNRANDLQQLSRKVENVLSTLHHMVCDVYDPAAPYTTNFREVLATLFVKRMEHEISLVTNIRNLHDIGPRVGSGKKKLQEVVESLSIGLKDNGTRSNENRAEIRQKMNALRKAIRPADINDEDVITSVKRVGAAIVTDIENIDIYAGSVITHLNNNKPPS